MTEYDYNYDLAIREVGGQVVVTNNLGRAALYGELVFLGGYLGFVMEFAGIANAASGRIALLDECIEFTTSQVEATDTFTAGNTAYFEGGGSSAAGTIVDAATATTVPIGTIRGEQGTGGSQTHVTVRAFPPNNPGLVAKVDANYAAGVKVAKVVIDAATDYSTTGKAVSIPVGATIIDVWAISTALSSSGTAQVMNGASAVHTAIAMATDQAVARMAAGVDDTKLLVGADAITVKTHALGDAGIVLISYI